VACLPSTADAGFQTLWPKSAPRIDGVVICYDVTQEASFGYVRDLLGEHVVL
jgi:hypothetical protein